MQRGFRRDYCLPKRYLAISIRDKFKSRSIGRIQRMIVAAIVDLEDEDEDEDEDDDDDEEEDNLEEMEILEALLRFYIVKRRMLLFEPDHFARRCIINIPRTLRSFPTIDIGNLFRFRCREDIRRLIDVWRLPVEENGRILVSD